VRPKDRPPIFDTYEYLPFYDQCKVSKEELLEVYNESVGVLNKEVEYGYTKSLVAFAGTLALMMTIAGFTGSTAKWAWALFFVAFANVLCILTVFLNTEVYEADASILKALIIGKRKSAGYHAGLMKAFDGSLPWLFRLAHACFLAGVIAAGFAVFSTLSSDNANAESQLTILHEAGK